MNNSIDTEAERLDIFGKLKDCFNFLTSIVINEGESIALRISAARVLVEIAKILRHFLQDEEKFDKLEKEVSEIKKRMQKKERSVKR